MRRKTKIKTIISILAFAAIVAAAAFGLHYIDTRPDPGGGKDQGSAADRKYVYIGDHEYEVTHNLENYLLIGSDDSGSEDGTKKGKYHGGLADFIMLLVIDKTDDTYGFLPIDRDTITNVPIIDEKGEEGEDAEEQICCARWYGEDPDQGCENTVDCVSDLLGALEIDGYYNINMHDIGTLNHAVGGVTVTIKDDLTKQDPAMKPGAAIKLTDKQAEIFVRSRMDVGDGTNRSRMDRQQAYMDGFREAAKAKMSEDPDLANELYEELQDRAVTDMPGNRVSAVANHMYKGKCLGTFNIEGRHKEGTKLNDGLVHMEFYPSEDSIAAQMIKLCSLRDNGEI